jgi:hypothetical protein
MDSTGLTMSGHEPSPLTLSPQRLAFGESLSKGKEYQPPIQLAT